jgi:hypothetical protein
MVEGVTNDGGRNMQQHQTYHPKRPLSKFAVAVLAVFFAIGIFAVFDDPLWGLPTVIVCGGGLLFHFRYPKWMSISLTPEELQVRRLWKTSVYKWDEVENFRATTTDSRVRWLKPGTDFIGLFLPTGSTESGPMVGFDYSNSNKRWMDLNARLSGSEGWIAGDFGIGNEQLANVLNSYKLRLDTDRTLSGRAEPTARETED